MKFSQSKAQCISQSANFIVFALGFIWLILALISVALGNYRIGFGEIVAVLMLNSDNQTAQSVIWGIRVPRILLSSLCGGVLALTGLSLQAVFKNPLVGPHIVGVSTAAAFGGALCILLGFGSFYIVGFAFFFGILALLLLFFLAKFVSKADIFLLILAGIVINGVFAALTSLIQYLADNESVLPNIIYWLLGSFVRANYDKLTLISAISLPCVAFLIMIRYRFNLLSLNDDLKVLEVDHPTSLTDFSTLHPAYRRASKREWQHRLSLACRASHRKANLWKRSSKIHTSLFHYRGYFYAIC